MNGRTEETTGCRSKGRAVRAVLVAVLVSAWVTWIAGPAQVCAQGDADAKPPGTLELHVKNQELTTVLKLLAQQHRVNIVAGKGITGKVSCDLYNVTLDEALKAILQANGMVFQREGKFIYVYTAEELADIVKAKAKRETRIIKLSYLNAAEALRLVQPALSKTALVAVSSPAEIGIPSGGDEVGGDSYSYSDCIVITDFEDNVAKAVKIIEEMDVRPLQVLVEATILEVTLDEDNKLGVDFNVLAGIDFQDLTGVTTVSISDPTGLGTGTTSINKIPFGQAYTQGFATAGEGLNIGILTGNVAIFLNALENVTDINILSNPKVLVLNKQRAEVIVGERLGYFVQTSTETATTQTVEFLDTGTRLSIRPFVSKDGFIRMEVHPEVSSGTVSPLGLPSKTTTEVTSNIMVKDGNTIVIGGLIKETTSIVRKQVPGLGNIPGVGWLFRSKSDDTLRKEIIILLTPHIIKDEEAYAKARKVTREVERRIKGLREGFAFYSRERLTAGHVKAAADYLRDSDADPFLLDKALWETRRALYMAPNNLKAMELKDRITRRIGSRIRTNRTFDAIWKRATEDNLVKELPRSSSPAGKPKSVGPPTGDATRNNQTEGN